jgi:hypothetical protein
METQLIKDIKKIRDDIKLKLETMNKTQYYTSSFGSEKEYNGKGLYLGLESLITDVSYLIKAHNIFISISTYEERSQIKGELSNIYSYLDNPQYLWQYVDSLKKIIRQYNVRGNSERWELLADVNRKLLEQTDEFQIKLTEVDKIKKIAETTNSSIKEKSAELNEKFEELEEKINEVEEIKSTLEANSEKLKTINNNLEVIKEEADENLENIKEIYNDAKSNEKIIDSFAQKVQERDKRLGELQQITEENKEKIIVYESERIKILEEANKLIESAKTALNYKTAEGISASFQSQHEDARNWKFSVAWIIASAIFIGIAIGLGIWIAFGETDKLHLIIARIALIPLPIIGAIFCANQYVKQKNIIEDYAYKMVLAKSIVGFSEQLKKDPSEDKGEYIHYMKVALEEIHKDPLRKRSSSKESSSNSKIENFSVKDVLEVAERIVKIGKE